MQIINLLLIATVIVFCVDLSGGMDSLSKFVWKKMYPTIPYDGWRIPLFGCSLCDTWWAGILYILITGFSWKMLAVVALIAFFTDFIGSLLVLIKDLLSKVIDCIYRFTKF